MHHIHVFITFAYNLMSIQKDISLCLQWYVTIFSSCCFKKKKLLFLTKHKIILWYKENKDFKRHSYLALEESVTVPALLKVTWISCLVWWKANSYQNGSSEVEMSASNKTLFEKLQTNSQNEWNKYMGKSSVKN